MYPNLSSFAANQCLSNGNPAYTTDTFSADFPGVVGVPTGILAQFIAMANDAVTQDRWGASWEYGMGLFVAHFATLYLQAFNPNAATGADTAQAAAPTGLLTAMRGPESSVTFEQTAILAGTKSWGAWNLTAYGQQFATLARVLGTGGAWVG
jgi:hypothetical protein